MWFLFWKQLNSLFKQLYISSLDHPPLTFALEVTLLFYTNTRDCEIMETYQISKRTLSLDKNKSIDWNYVRKDIARVEVWRWIFARSAVNYGEKIFAAYFLHLFAVNAVNRGKFFFHRVLGGGELYFSPLDAMNFFFHRI